ncbi:hypothetical protein OAQ11_00500 [Opitutales bacterium]|nr:hypothetical protein [Opitutales bacterium]
MYYNLIILCHREPLAGVAIHCEPMSEPHHPITFPETRWIAASVTFVPSSQ